MMPNQRDRFSYRTGGAAHIVSVLDEGLGFWRNKGYATHTGMDP